MGKKNFLGPEKFFPTTSKPASRKKTFRAPKSFFPPFGACWWFSLGPFSHSVLAGCGLGRATPNLQYSLCCVPLSFAGPKLNHQQASTECARKAGLLLVVGKELFGPQKVFFPHSVLSGPKPSIFIVLSWFPHSCAQRSSEKNVLICSRRARPHFRRGALQMCLAIGLRRDQHKPKLSTLRRARQTHQGDFRLTLVSQNQNAKPCSEIPSALAYERMMSFQVS